MTMQRTKDPQVIVRGHLKSNDNGEFIVFSVRLGLFELVAIVNIPAEGETSAPVYVKFKVRDPAQDHRTNGDKQGEAQNQA